MLLPWVAPAALAAQSPVGQWKTIDDVSGQERSIVELYEVNGKLHGRVLQIFPAPGEPADPVCDKCAPSDPRYNRRILGMEILSGLRKSSATLWEDGKILDPKNGSVYSCYIKVLDNGAKIELRGYIGFSLIGRTQYWHRVK